MTHAFRADDTTEGPRERPFVVAPTQRSPRRLLVSLLATALSACAAPPPGGARLQVATAADWSDMAALQRAAAQAAGVPVLETSAVSSRQFVLVLDCADAPACDAARERLRASPLFTDVA